MQCRRALAGLCLLLLTTTACATPPDIPPTSTAIPLTATSTRQVQVSPTSTALPTDTIRPTHTLTPGATATPTSTPTPTPSPTATLRPAPIEPEGPPRPPGFEPIMPVPTEPVPTEPVPTEPLPTEPIPTRPVPTEPAADANAAEAVPVPEEYAALLAAVREQGSIRVIVRLDVPFQPEGELPDEQAVQAQRQAIAEAQDRLLRRMSGLNINHVTTYEFIPSMAMSVDEAALRDLIANPEVTSIEQDIPVGPAAPASP